VAPAVAAAGDKDHAGGGHPAWWGDKNGVKSDDANIEIFTYYTIVPYLIFLAE
jgi:hypothetical protein